MKIRVLAFTGQDSYFFTMFNSKLLLCGGGFRKVLDAGRAFSDALKRVRRVPAFEIFRGVMKLNTSDSYKIMAKEIIYLTAEGYKKLRDELDHMRSVERPAISAAIAEARDKGDLSENAEYDAAREAQGMLEMRIAKLEDSLANARVIDESKIDKSKVQILSKVTLLNHNTKKEMAYTDRRRARGQPARRASWPSARRSPRRCWAARRATGVDVEVPAGTIHFEILDISI